MSSEPTDAPEAQPEAFKWRITVPWSEAPEAPNARFYLRNRSKLVYNPDTVVWLDAGADTATVNRKPPGYDAFHDLFHTDVRAACTALNQGEYSNDCLGYYINSHPLFLEKEEPGAGRCYEELLGKEESLKAQFAFAREVRWADDIGWASEKGVWVLEGGKENHERLLTGWEKGVDWVDQLKRAGALWYDDCEPPFSFSHYWCLMRTPPNVPPQTTTIRWRSLKHRRTTEIARSPGLSSILHSITKAKANQLSWSLDCNFSSAFPQAFGVLATDLTTLLSTRGSIKSRTSRRY
jgi:hypothetical protein